MALYRVQYRVEIVFSHCVEASSEEEAREVAGLETLRDCAEDIQRQITADLSDAPDWSMDPISDPQRILAQ